MRPIAWPISLILFALALALHLFYIDYQIDSVGYIYSFPATRAQQDELVRRHALRYVQPERIHYIESPTNAELIAMERRYKRENCAYNGNKTGAWAYFNLDEYDCARPYKPPRIVRTPVTIPGVPYQAALERAQAEISARDIRFGARPSLLISGIVPSKAMIQRAFWMGVLFPLLLLSASACVLAIRLKRDPRIAADDATSTPRKPASNDDAAETKNAVPSEAASPQQKSLASMLLEDLGSNFPVSSGNGKRDDPLQVTAETDYVGVEYAVVEHVLRAVREDYKLSKQQLITDGDRKIDELIFDVKPIGADDWTGLRRFYFDITAGFDKL